MCMLNTRSHSTVQQVHGPAKTTTGMLGTSQERSRSRGLTLDKPIAKLAMVADDSSDNTGTASDQPPSGSPLTPVDRGPTGLWT